MYPFDFEVVSQENAHTHLDYSIRKLSIQHFFPIDKDSYSGG